MDLMEGVTNILWINLPIFLLEKQLIHKMKFLHKRINKNLEMREKNINK